MEKSNIKDIETNRAQYSKEELVKEGQAINQSMRNVNKLVLEKKATVEIKIGALGNKMALIRQGEELIYSTDNVDEIANFELFLTDPETAAKKFQQNFELQQAEQKIEDELSSF